MRSARYSVPLFKAYILRKQIYFKILKTLSGEEAVCERSAQLGTERCPKEIPKIVWIYWAQGEENAPEIVQFCIESWRAKNKNWDIRVLNDETVARYIENIEAPENITIQAYSDILRVNLLNKYGGVWADATCYCAKPLDHWLLPLTQSGFFAFSNPHPDRIISSWFLASEKDGVIVSLWKNAIDTYWKGTKKADHYLWLHYLFEYFTKRNKIVLDLWGATPHISAKGPHLLKRIMTQKSGSGALEDNIARDAIPVFKLTWKDDISVSDIERWIADGHDIVAKAAE